MQYAKLQSSAKHLVVKEKQIKALTMTAVVGTAYNHNFQNNYLNLIALQPLGWCCDKTTDLMVHQAARNQRLKPMVKCFG